MVEGQGDKTSVPGLTQRLIQRYSGEDTLYLGGSFRNGGISKIAKNHGEVFLKHLEFAIDQYKDLGAVLLLLDGDAPINPFILDREEVFCARQVARTLAEMARDKARAGELFSFAAVFAVLEFESWILAGHPKFRDEMKGLDVETAPRNAKGKIRELSKTAYHETLDQQVLSREIDLERLLTREPPVRSFLRLDHAIRELIEAVRTGKHVSTPYNQ
jgi:hypothetical protein